MTIDQSSLPQRVANYYSLLSEAAKDLNSISDELGKPIAEVDSALKKVNLGVAVDHDRKLPIQSFPHVRDIQRNRFPAELKLFRWSKVRHHVWDRR